MQFVGLNEVCVAKESNPDNPDDCVGDFLPEEANLSRIVMTSAGGAGSQTAGMIQIRNHPSAGGAPSQTAGIIQIRHHPDS